MTDNLSTATPDHQPEAAAVLGPDSGRRGGAPRGNRNRHVHGLRSARSGGFILGELPERFRHIKRVVDQFRRLLEGAVGSNRGTVSLTDEATIQTACRAERHALLCGRWLADGGDELTVDQRVALSREVVKASESRDKAIRELRLDSHSRGRVFAAIARAHSGNDHDDNPDSEGETGGSGRGGESVVLVGEFDEGGGNVGAVVEQMTELAGAAASLAGAARGRRKTAGVAGGEAAGEAGAGLAVAGQVEAALPGAVIPAEAVRITTGGAIGTETDPPATSPAATGEQIPAEQIPTETEATGSGWASAGWSADWSTDAGCDSQADGEAGDSEAVTDAAGFEFDTSGFDLGGLDAGQDEIGEQAAGRAGDESSDDDQQADDDRPGEAKGDQAKGDQADRVPVPVASDPVAVAVPVAGFDWSLGTATKPTTSTAKPATTTKPKRKGQG